jgi:hypothetical protein
MRHEIVSFYFDGLSPSIVRSQKKVFDYLDIPLKQIKFSTTHGNAIDSYLENLTDWDLITIFDVDCIPLSKKPIDEIYKYVNDSTIYGNAQISNSTPYCAPSFISFTKNLYLTSPIKSFEPSFYPDETGKMVEADCGEIFSKENLKNNKKIILSYPKKVLKEKWFYDGNNEYKKFSFGNGTTYNNDTFHYFQIRFEEHQNDFIKYVNNFINEKN